MKLTIVIVSYNVRPFLDHTLYSVFKSETEYKYEIFVVDNNSSDDSVLMVQEKYPDTKLIVNDDNPGFSVANNQAIHKSIGEYVLLLNPDTIIQEDTIQKIIEFMDRNMDAGALGVPMIDGSGAFLPESKRGFPSPWVSFSKMTGLSSAFPTSRVFNSYHLGFLDADENHEVDILAGAFLLLRRTVLDEIGLLDESFFMYGEDIDLSYRIQKAGYKNYYLADTKIIHFKGESTKKASFKYVKTFYNAMIIFGKKHFAKSQRSVLLFFLNIAIYLKAGLAFLKHIWKKSYTFLIDNIVIVATGLLITELWEYFNFYEGYFSLQDNIYNLLLYSIVYTGVLYLNGAYDKKPKLSNFLKSLMYSSIVLVAIYGLMNESIRFSRAVVFFLSISTFISLTLWRNVLSLFSKHSFWQQQVIVDYLVAGNSESADLVMSILSNNDIGYNNYEVFCCEGRQNVCRDLKVQIDNFIARSGKFKTLVFVFPHIRNEDAISIMELYGDKLKYEFIIEDETILIGSESKEYSGSALNSSGNLNLIHANYKRQKFIIDYVISLCALLIAPVILWRVDSVALYFKNIGDLILRRKTWIAYNLDESLDSRFPLLPIGIVDSRMAFQDDRSTESNSNLRYARDYSPWIDFSVYMKNPKLMGKMSNK